MNLSFFKKSIVAIIAANTCLNAYAIGNGFYMGVMMGPANNKGSVIQAQSAESMPQPPTEINPPPFDIASTFTPATPRSQQFGTRIFIGNQFNRFAAIELGGTYFSSIQYDTKGVETTGGTDQRVRDIDLVLKGIFAYKAINLYGKAGVAALYITTSGGLNPTYQPAVAGSPPGVLPLVSGTEAITRGSNTYKHKFAPTFSVGASYDINQSWEADISANMIQVGNDIGRITFYTIGLAYHFTDKYCGQFLCDD